MSRGTKEIHFEEHIEEYLTREQGYHTLASDRYDKKLCLVPEELITFIKDTQPKKYKVLEEQYSSQVDEHILVNVQRIIKKEGVLVALRSDVKILSEKISLYYPRPQNNKNPLHQALASKNRFGVMRQLKYSESNENSIDMGIFLNGLPIFTVELKNALTGQYLAQAVKQYKEDRDPAEPLLAYKRCLCHFAVSTEAAKMCTRLMKDKSYFLPFNIALSNPINEGGFKTAYLWENIWTKSSILDLIQNFIHEHEEQERTYNEKKKAFVSRPIRYTVFPRYHQLRAVRRILEALREDGVGKNYLIQHSAGSGKSFSISWLAHQLSNFFQQPDDAKRLFDSIIVVTDRRVLDRQIQNNISQFEQVPGVVECIDEKKTSQDLKKAIEDGKSIIITTLQKFPVISDTVAGFTDRNYAVIVDEAHSSQTGEGARHLRKALSLEQAELIDEEEELDDIVTRELSSKGRQDNISFFAFTATPKNKTLELFGTMRNGKLEAFDTYSMHQAINEGFIRDVLENYIHFKRYYKLAKRPDIEDDEYEIRKTVRLLNNYVDLQDHAIETKSRIMLEHFMSKTVNEIQGQARAMLVTRSRLHAVRYKRKFDQLMGEMKLPYKALVAFSGTVYDKEVDEDYTETNMNKLAGRISIPDALKTNEFRILIAANKFQTGFDEPLLHTMFVDKKLGGVSTVQTLSRLNRRKSGKNGTMVLDFVNDPEKVQKDFQEYYGAVFMKEEDQTDPNKLNDLQRILEHHLIYSQQELDAFADVFFKEGDNKQKLQPILDTVSERFAALEEDAQLEYRKATNDFIKIYRFLSQIITFKDVEWEKIYAFHVNLRKKFPYNPNYLPVEVLEEVELAEYNVQKKYETNLPLLYEDAPKYGLTIGSSAKKEEEYDWLSNIIKTLNDSFGLPLTEEQAENVKKVILEVENSKDLDGYFNKENSKQDIKHRFDEEVDERFLTFVNSSIELYNMVTQDKANKKFKDILFERLYDERVRPNL